MPSEKSPFPHSGVAMIISNADDPSPPQNIYDPTTLTQAQMTRVRSRIKQFLADLRAKRDASNFAQAARWVMKVYSYDILLSSDFIPMPTYGASFLEFAAFVDRKEKDAEAEEVVEEEEGGQRE